MILFRHGDCKDACIGTLLLHYGVSRPECMIFKDLRFTISRTTEGKHCPLEVSYRAEEYMMEEITERTGISFQFCRPKNFDAHVSQIEQYMAQGRPVVVAVDHYEYEHSQFYQSVHMPHYIIITAHNSKEDEYAYDDPYPFFDVRGTLTLADLRRLSDSPGLLQYRNEFFVLDASRPRAFDPDSYLVDTWREVARGNIQNMLENRSGGGNANGVHAIRKMASHVAEWIGQEGFSAYTSQFRNFPVSSSLVDVGGDRAGHSLYLHQVGQLLGEKVFFELEERYKEISSCWNTVSAIRNLYQENKILESWKIDPKFVERKLRRMPSLISIIADMEEESINILQRFIKRRGVL